MAEVLDGFDFQRIGRPARYPWDEWCDGQIRRIRRHSDFDVECDSMQHYIWTTARRRGLRAQTQRVGPDAIVFRIVSDPLRTIDTDQGDHR